ncbi:MAG: cadmium-translocating P-type ATPase [Candidatus Aquiluna sp. XM-24bin5]|nr:MAG: cadmium-translocating P-type ATPase [Candidatus Aquiluna sp. XM-24bin5]
MANNLVELDIEGMTCTACARRVEKTLNRVDGVTAYVDFASEKAHLQFAGEIELDVLKEAVASAGYKVGEGKEELKTLKPRLITGAVLSLLAMVFSMVPGIEFEGQQFLVWALATPVILYVSFPFHAAAIKNLRHGDTTMDTLVSLGSSVAYLYSIYLVLTGSTHHYFEVSAVVPSVVLLGRFIEVRARRSATDSVRALLSAIPDSATVIRDGTREQVPTHTLRAGDEVVVVAGDRVPADGTLVSEFASVDNSTLTGESLPVELRAGEALSAGATVLSGEVIIRLTASAGTSRLSRIADLVREATASKTQLGSLTDRISSVFVPSVIVISIATYFVWALALGDSTRAFEAAVAVLVIACPCALGIAVPMSLVVATSLGTKKSVVIRNPDSLRLLARINKVVFDKTGTLTDGKLSIVKAHGLGGVTAEDTVAKAAAVEAGSKHPVAMAIAASGTTYVASNIEEISGRGVAGDIDALRVSVEKPGIYENQAELDAAIQNAGPNTLVVVAWEGWAHGLIELSDGLREGARETVSELHSMGLKVAMLSGDNQRRVDAVAGQLGLDEALASASPEGKLEYLTSQPEKLAMVGDGINDVAALASADIGIAMGSGAQAAQAASAITVLDDDPRKIPSSLKLGRRTYRNILQNLGWAFGYNILLIPVAAAGLLNPMLAGVAMAFSSVSVVANALRMKLQD